MVRLQSTIILLYGLINDWQYVSLPFFKWFTKTRAWKKFFALFLRVLEDNQSKAEPDFRTLFVIRKITQATNPDKVDTKYVWILENQS